MTKQMNWPVRETSTSKNGRIQVNGKAHHVVDRSRIEIHVAVEILVFFHIFFNDVRYFIPPAVASTPAQILGHGTQVSSAWILGTIDAMTKAHNALFMFQRITDIRFSIIYVTHTQNHTH